jgi:hypothetical protein
MLRRGVTTGRHHPSPERPCRTGYGSVLARPGVGCFTVAREAYPGTQTISALGAT